MGDYTQDMIDALVALCDGCDRTFPTGQIAADDAGSGQFCHPCRYVANHGASFDWRALDYEED